MDLDLFKNKAADGDFKYITAPPCGDDEESDSSEKGFHNSNGNFKGRSKGLATTSSQGYEESIELKTDSQLFQDPLASTIDTNRTTFNPNSVQKDESAHSAMNFNGDDEELVIGQRKPEGDPNKTNECQKIVSEEKLPQTEYRNESNNVYRYVTNLISDKNNKSALSQELKGKFGNEKPTIDKERVEEYLEKYKSINYFTDSEDRPKKHEILYWILATILSLKVVSIDYEKDDQDLVEMEDSICENITNAGKILKILVALCSKSIKLGLKDECQNILENFGFTMGMGEQMGELTSARKIATLEGFNSFSNCKIWENTSFVGKAGFKNQAAFNNPNLLCETALPLDPLKEHFIYPSLPFNTEKDLGSSVIFDCPSNETCSRKVQPITKNYQLSCKEGQQIKISFKEPEQKPTQNSCTITSLEGLNSFSNCEVWGNTLSEKDMEGSAISDCESIPKMNE